MKFDKNYSEILRYKQSIIESDDFLFQLLEIEKEKSQNNIESQNNNSGQNNRKKKNNKEDHKLNSILDDIRNKEKLINILNMEENPKKIIKKAAKIKFASKLKEAMKIFMKIFESMKKEEFDSKIPKKMPMNLLNPYRNMNNDIEMIDSHEDAITNYVLEPDDFDSIQF